MSVRRHFADVVIPVSWQVRLGCWRDSQVLDSPEMNEKFNKVDLCTPPRRGGVDCARFGRILV